MVFIGRSCPYARDTSLECWRNVLYMCVANARSIISMFLPKLVQKSQQLLFCFACICLEWFNFVILLQILRRSGRHRLQQINKNVGSEAWEHELAMSLQAWSHKIQYGTYVWKRESEQCGGANVLKYRFLQEWEHEIRWNTQVWEPGNTTEQQTCLGLQAWEYTDVRKQNCALKPRGTQMG